MGRRTAGWSTSPTTRQDTPGYDEDDFIPSLRESLSYEGNDVLGAVLRRVVVPDVPQGPVEEAGITSCRTATAHLAGGRRRGQDASTTPDRAGICLRGKPGWGEVLAPLDTVINTFGGRWFDEEWNAQLTSPEVERAVHFYVDTVRSSR